MNTEIDFHRLMWDETYRKTLEQKSDLEVLREETAALEAANAELTRRVDKLAAFLGEIEMNARGRCVDLEQANWKLEQIQKRAYLALDGKLE